MMDFISFARAHGVDIESLQQGESIRRCPTLDHPRSRNGAYWFDGMRGWCINWEYGDSVQWWNDLSARPWSEQEKSEWARKRKQADAAKKKLQIDAAKRAAALIKSANHSRHPYMVEKGFPESIGLVSADGDLIIPMHDFKSNELLGAQRIRLVDNRWEKKMEYGMRAKGAVLRYGPKIAMESILVEGYATGRSVDLALRLLRLNVSVVVCFSAQNLVYVAQNGAGRRMVFADNDASHAGEKAAAASGLPFCMSDQIGEDANDVHSRAGIMAVAKIIMEVRRKGF